MCRPFWTHGIVRRAIESKLITAEAVDIRAFATDRHQSTDDRPFGGGSGMVMTPAPLVAAIRSVRRGHPGMRTVLLSPQGRVFDQDMAREFAAQEGIALICGRYEGIDERVCLNCVDDEVSLGDYVLTGGELGAMIIMDAVTRLIPGALGGEDAADKESFAGSRLEHAHYTRPREFEGEGVPDVLLSGDHAAIARWRAESALIRTFLKRRDLLGGRHLAQTEIELLKQWRKEIDSIIKAQGLRGTGSPSGG